jgi:hypothetical protein
VTSAELDTLTDATAEAAARRLPEGCCVVVLVLDARGERSDLYTAHSSGDELCAILRAAAAAHDEDATIEVES